MDSSAAVPAPKYVHSKSLVPNQSMKRFRSVGIVVVNLKYRGGNRSIWKEMTCGNDFTRDSTCRNDSLVILPDNTM